ncbi:MULTISPECIES: flagellar hook capping FlgD N-terminal domain-containing protein [Falsihalocynthiibacter]|uniref:flagellar hook capping FlgD N-terminal domain-containing protein n=1 Tax=Falsihalocynthiibacter TaxID=2854182 RepID=UPI0030012109
MEVTQSSPALQTSSSQIVSESQTDAASLSSDFDTFLKMLTAQVTNQDPLNPTDSTDFAAQLATFSNVEQSVKTNELLENLVAQFGGSGMAEMASWVGMEARIEAPAHFSGSPVTISPNPIVGADQNFLVVRDSDGTVVQRNEIPVSAGALEWAGVDDGGTPFENGLYTFALDSFKNGEQMGEIPVEVYSRVTEARGEGGITVLVLEGGAMANSADVTGLREAA